jgi:molybdopterin molybdotransferase
VKKLSGQHTGWGPNIIQGITTQAIKGDNRRETYVWGQAQLIQGQYQFSAATGSQTSGNLINLAGINSLAVIPSGQSQIAAGQPVRLMLI